MSQTLWNNPRRSTPALAPGLASFILLSCVFVATMLLHYRSIDFTYLSFALVRIVGISTLIAAVAFAIGRKLRSLLVTVLFGTSGLLLACAHSPGTPKTDHFSGIDLSSVEKRFGFPGCKVSVPLTPDEVLRTARLSGDPEAEQRQEWTEMTGMIKDRDQLRMVSCLPSRGRGGVVFFGLFRNRSMVAELHTVIID